MKIKRINQITASENGLVYLRGDGDAVMLEYSELWLMALLDGEVELSRYCDGIVNESYRSMDMAEAAVAVAAVIQGFEPPRGLCRRDTPPRQIPPGPDSHREI